MGPVDWSSEHERFIDGAVPDNAKMQACVMWDIPVLDVNDDDTLDGF